MNRIAKFEKVSFEQFRQDFKTCMESYDCNYSENEIKEAYDSIKLPTRATTGSAGYDFKIPMDMMMTRNEEYIIPTGIRARIEDGWVLQLYPRSGLGFKFGMRLLNTVGIIDSDYYYSGNEGHIMAKITYTINKDCLEINSGTGFMQGLFMPFGITEDDKVTQLRDGGFGSTGM